MAKKLETCALCKHVIKGRVLYSRWFSPIGKRKAFHESCLADLEDLFLEDRWAFTIIATTILAGLILSITYFVKWETDELGYAPIAGWAFLPSLIIGVGLLGVSAWLLLSGPKVLKHPQINRFTMRGKRKPGK